jgi:hypothetical protein
VVEMDGCKTDEYGVKPNRSVIEFDNGRFFPWPSGDEEFEVIGNIYENSDLLK